LASSGKAACTIRPLGHRARLQEQGTGAAVHHLRQPAATQKTFSSHIPYGPVRTDAVNALPADIQQQLPTAPGNLAEAQLVNAEFWVDHGEELEERHQCLGGALTLALPRAGGARPGHGKMENAVAAMQRLFPIQEASKQMSRDRSIRSSGSSRSPTWSIASARRRSSSRCSPR
jgi:hypothetical protein